MPRFTMQRYEQILQNMIARVVTRGGMSDVSDTSVTKHLLAAQARALDEAYYQASLILQNFSIDTATGADLDARAKDIQPGTMTRMPSANAVGLVVFSRSTVVGTITVPSGTQVKTSDGVIFATTAATTITPTSPTVIAGHAVGRDSALTPVSAVQPGSNGNVVAGAVIKFVQKPGGVDSVTNPGAFAQGQDQETDDAFRQRLKNYVASLSRGTVQALESGVLGSQDPTTGDTIIFSKAVEDPNNVGNVTLYIDDGTGAAQTQAVAVNENMCLGLAGPPSNSAVGGEVRIFLAHHPINIINTYTLSSSIRGALTQGTHYTLDPTSGLVVFTPALVTSEVVTANYTYYTGLVALAQKVVDGDPANRTSFPGIRAAGIKVVVQTPQVVLITVNATLTVASGFDPPTVQAAALQAILSYIDSLGISGDVTRATLFQRVMGVPGVANMLLSAPTQDIPILDSQLARVTNANVTIS